MAKRQLRMSLSVAVLSMLVCACATIDPVPVNDTNRNSAKGIRYFEARPFVVVNKPFPLESKSAIVDGIVSPDGKSIFVTGAVGSDFLHYKMPGAINLKDLVILQPVEESALTRMDTTPAAQASVDESGTPPPTSSETRSGEESGSAPDNAPEAANGQDDTTTKDDKDKDASTNTASKQAGFSSVTVTHDNAGQAIIPLNEYITLTYMPDFEREFVVSAEGRFGIKNLKLLRAPGGVLLGFNAEVDNTAVMHPLMEAYSSVVKTGSKALIAAISPGGAAVAAAQAEISTQQAPVKLRAQPITFRLHKVKFATPGIYPVVKQSEVPVYLAAYPGGASDSIVVPRTGYQIPYHYFELLVAEPLIVSDPLAFAVAKSDGSKDNQGGTRGPVTNPAGCDKQVRTSILTTDSVGVPMIEAGGDIKVIDIKDVQENPKGCVSQLSAAVVKEVNGVRTNLTADEKKKAQGSFNATYVNTVIKLLDPVP